MHDRIKVSLDQSPIELRKHQILLIPVVHRTPLERYAVRLIRAWNALEIDLVVPTAHLISPEGFSLVKVIRPRFREYSAKDYNVEIDTDHGRTLYHFFSQHRAPIAALQQRFEALPQRARALRQTRIDTTLDTIPIPPSMTLQVDPEVRVDLTRVSRRTQSGTIDIVFARSAEPAQIVDMFGPVNAWRDGNGPAIRIDVEHTLVGRARYFLSWRSGVTTTLVIDIGSRAASNFHQYMMQVAGHDEAASDAVQLPIATSDLSRGERLLAIGRLRNHALTARKDGSVDAIADEVWAHVLNRRQAPRALVYPSSDMLHTEFERLCDEVIATQHIHQFCNNWFRQQTLPLPELATLNAVIDNAGQDATAYSQTVPPLLRQLEVPFSGLHPNQVDQVFRSLRRAWLTSSAENLTLALQRHRLLRSAALRQALLEHDSMVIDWLLPETDGVSRTTSVPAAWSAIVTAAMRTTSAPHERMTHHQRFMQLRHTLTAKYPDYDQLRQAELKQLLRQAGVHASLHHLALIEFEAPETNQAQTPARLHFIEDLLQDAMPDDIPADTGLYHFQPQSDPLAWKATSLRLPALTLLLKQANSFPRQQHHREMTRYWAEHGAAQSGGDDAHALLLSAQACLAAHDLCCTGHLSPSALQYIISAAGFGTSDDDDVQCHLLDLGGVISTDLVTIRGGDAGVVLYRPGQWPQFQQYTDLDAMRQAIAADCASDMARRRWAAHFAPETRPDSFKAGIDTLLLRLGCGEAINRIALAEHQVRIEGDVFFQIARRQQHAAEYSSTMSEALCSSPWSNAERFFDDDLDLSEHPASGPWMDALVVALDLLEQGRPAWNRDSHLVATPPTGLLALPAEVQQELLQAACRQEQEQAHWHQCAPDIANDGAHYMRFFLRATFPERFTGGIGDPDIDKLVLNEYHPPQSHVAYYMINSIRLLNRRKSSIPLSQLSYCNIDVVSIWDSLINSGNRYFTISLQDAVPEYYDKDFDNVVDPMTLVRAIIDGKDFDFAEHHKQEIVRYFTGYGETLARLAREQALLSAKLMLHEGQLSNDDYRLAVSALGPAGDRPTDVAITPLRIGGHAARDCLHLHCKANGRRLLYLAGDDIPYLAFDHLAAARKFLLDLGRDAQRVNDFAHTHFAQEHADDRRAPGAMSLTTVPGVISVLRTIDQASMLNDNPQLLTTPPKSAHDAIVRRRSATRLRDLLDDKTPISGDPFMMLVEISQQGAVADATYFIRSATDRMKETWMEYARIIPVDFVEGLARLVLGKTAADVRSARLSLGTDLALSLIPITLKIRRTANPVISIAGSRSAHALARGMLRREPVARLARWFKPPQRLNGKIGYPLSPSRPPLLQRAERKMASMLLDMRVCNATTNDAQRILHTAVPAQSTRWYTVATQAVRLDQAATHFFLNCALPPRHYLRQLGNVDELFDMAYRSAPASGYGGLGRGLIIGEKHTITAARRFLNDNLEQLATCGVKTLYTEVFKRDADADLLRIFNAGGTFPEHILARLRHLDARATPRSLAEFADGRSSASLLDLFDNARRHGLEVRAIDNVPASAPAYLSRPFTSTEPRISSMNYVAYRIIRHDQAHFRQHAWVAHMGAAHATRIDAIPGVNQLTGTPSLFVCSNSTPVAMTFGDYHLKIDSAGATPQFRWAR